MRDIRQLLKSLALAISVYTFLSSAVFAEESLFDSEGLLDDNLTTEFDDDSTEFDTNGGKSSNTYPQLKIDLRQKWEVNSVSDLSTTELRLSTAGTILGLAYGEIELKATHYWSDDVKHANNNDIEIKKSFLQLSNDDWSTKVGRYTIGWGEQEGGALDVVNPSGILLEFSQNPQWLMSITRYWPESNLSTFYNANPIISTTSGLAIVDESHQELGLRYGFSKEDGDRAFYMGQLIPNTTVMNLATGQNYASPYKLFGFSMNKTIDNYLLKFDIAYKHNLEHNRASQLVNANRLDWNIGLDIRKGDSQQMLSIISQHWLDYHNDYLTPALPLPISTKRNNINYFASFSDTFKNKDFSWNLANIITSNGDMSLISAGIDWDINDQWNASLNATNIDAKSKSAFSVLDGYQSVQMEIKYLY